MSVTAAGPLNTDEVIEKYSKMSLTAAGPLNTDEVIEEVSGPNKKYVSSIFHIKKRGNNKTIKIRKLVKLNATKSFTRIARFDAIREIKFYKYIQHVENWKDYILPFIHGSSNTTSAFLNFEYIKGTTLDRYLESPNIRIYKRKKIIKDLLDALQFCLDNEYMHGDVKMENIYITSSGDLRLFDFGKAVRDRAETGIIATNTEKRQELDYVINVIRSIDYSVYPYDNNNNDVYVNISDYINSIKRYEILKNLLFPQIGVHARSKFKTFRSKINGRRILCHSR